MIGESPGLATSGSRFGRARVVMTGPRSRPDRPRAPAARHTLVLRPLACHDVSRSPRVSVDIQGTRCGDLEPRCVTVPSVPSRLIPHQTGTDGTDPAGPARWPKSAGWELGSVNPPENEALRLSLERLQWRPERLARQLNDFAQQLGRSDSVDIKTPYKWLRGGTPRAPWAALCAALLSRELDEQISSESLGWHSDSSILCLPADTGLLAPWTARGVR